MHVVAYLSKFYDWVPVPDDVKVTPADIAAERVRPAANGGYRMRVTKKAPTYMTVHLSEAQICAKIIHEKTRPEGGRVLTRNQAIAFYVGENHLPIHAKREWITKIEVDDDGPEPELLAAMLKPHAVSEASRVQACQSAGKHDVKSEVTGAPARCASCGHMPSIDDPSERANIPAEEHAAHLAAYSEESSKEDLLAHLHTFFKVKAVKS
jgi:hypothetical protein